MSANIALMVKYRVILFLMDVERGNPNGDPDSDNEPRQDHETGFGLITDTSTKAKIRRMVELLLQYGKIPNEGNAIYVRRGSILNDAIKDAYVEAGVTIEEPKKITIKGKGKKKGDDDASATAEESEDREVEVNTEDHKRRASAADAVKGNQRLCEKYYDFRSFGGVVTGVGSGRITGPLQVAIGMSVEPITSDALAVTVQAARTKEESEKQKGQNQGMGRKHVIPYALYTQKATLNPFRAKESGYTEADFEILLEACKHMYEHERSTSRGIMTLRQIFIFEHTDPFGNARAADLWDLIKIERRDPSVLPRKFSDYKITVGKMPDGVTLKLGYPMPEVEQEVVAAE